jgi:hypothetical protein
MKVARIVNFRAILRRCDRRRNAARSFAERRLDRKRDIAEHDAGLSAI